MAKNIFDTFYNCLKGNAYNPDEPKSSFMFCRYLANSGQLIQQANFINCYYDALNDESQYKFIQTFKNRPKFIRWIKTNQTEEFDEAEIESICQKYKISKSKAQDYIKILRKESK